VNPSLLFVILSLATFRITWLIAKDDFPPIFYARKWIQMRRPRVVRRPAYAEGYADFWWLGELVSCVWCASGYVAGGLVLTVWLLHGLSLPLLWWFAVWGAGAFLANLAQK
jgi:hypothetical protein